MSRGGGVKLRTVEMSILQSGPGYSNRSARVVLDIEEGDTLATAKEKGGAALAYLLGESAPSKSEVLRAVNNAQLELREIAAKSVADDDDIPF